MVDVEPGFRVVHVDAGPPDLAKEDLPEILAGLHRRRVEQSAAARAAST